MKLKLKKLIDEAIIPTYATSGAACFDLHAYVPSEQAERLAIGESRVFRTGLAFEVPEGFVMMIYSRSGHGFKSDVRLSNCVGVIDSDYRGEVKVKLTRDESGNEFYVSHGDRIAQAMLIPSWKFEFEEVANIEPTSRGAGGFGSTGK